MRATYVITIEGHLHTRWSERLTGFAIEHQADGTTQLVGTVPDQAALYGLLMQLRDLGVTLLALERGQASKH